MYLKVSFTSAESNRYRIFNGTIDVNLLPKGYLLSKQLEWDEGVFLK
jgi:hypothetical protein